MRRPRDVDFIGLLSAALNVEDREVALSVKITRPVELPPGFCQVYVSINLILGVRAPFVKHFPRVSWRFLNSDQENPITTGSLRFFNPTIDL